MTDAAIEKAVTAAIQKMQAEAMEGFRGKLRKRLEDSRKECEASRDTVFTRGEMFAYGRVLNWLESGWLD